MVKLLVNLAGLSLIALIIWWFRVLPVQRRNPDGQASKGE